MACQKFTQPDSNRDDFTHDEDENHHTGENCMDYHYSAGYAEEIFLMAGSINENYRNGTVDVYKNTNKTSILEVEIYRLDNIYSENQLIFLRVYLEEQLS